MEAWRNVATQEASLSVDADLTVGANRGRLLQLFDNCFRNAVQHGGPTVAVTVGELDDGFYIADDGPGVPEEDRQEIFQAGFTTHDDRTGYGLNLVGDIIEAHGWRVSIAESESRGARFEIRGLVAS